MVLFPLLNKNTLPFLLQKRRNLRNEETCRLPCSVSTWIPSFTVLNIHSICRSDRNLSLLLYLSLVLFLDNHPCSYRLPVLLLAFFLPSSLHWVKILMQRVSDPMSDPVSARVIARVSVLPNAKVH